MSHAAQIRALRPCDRYRDLTSGITEQAFRDLCGTAPIWHSVDLGDLFIEGSKKTSEITYGEMQKAALPDLRGKSVLDIGAFGGWFSFEAERRGAARVVALDYHSWAVDWTRLLAYMREERAAGRIGDPYHPPSHVIDEINQPARATFDATRKILGSQVEAVLARVEDYDPGCQFDVVLYLGVLYHCENPLASLRKVAALTKELLIVETLGSSCPGLEEKPLWQFFGDDSVNHDVTTWWAPNDRGLADMLKAVGFRHVEITSGLDALPEGRRGKPALVRSWAHAWR